MNILNEDLGKTILPGQVSHPLTAQQQAVLDFPLDVGDLLKVRAYAGTGKTSTFVAYAAAHPDDRVTYLAFNKSVETEAKNKFGRNTLVKTVHALAYSKVGCKFSDIAGSIPIWQIAKLFRVPYYEAGIVQRSLEQFLNSAEDEVGEEHIVPDHLGRLSDKYKSDMVDAVDAIWEKMKGAREGSRMTHSGYLKLYQMSRPVIPGDYILLDEAQDTNPVTLSLVTRQREHGKKIIMVGDPYQQIYAWRGAVDAMQKVEGPELQLTQSWRFGSNIADWANLLLQTYFGEKIPLIGSGTGCNIDGKITTICRTNSEMFRQIIPLCDRGESFFVIGREAFMDSLDLLTDVYNLFAQKRSAIRDNRVKFFQDWKAYTDYQEATLDQEAGTRIQLVKSYGDSIPSIIKQMRALYTSNEADVSQRFVTCHKAKGLEWQTVRAAEDFAKLFDEKGHLKDLIPPGKERNDETVAADEINLLYVAATRSRTEFLPNYELKRLLSFVKQGCIEPEE